jgi:hypothetical protein
MTDPSKRVHAHARLLSTICHRIVVTGADSVRCIEWITKKLAARNMSIYNLIDYIATYDDDFVYTMRVLLHHLHIHAQVTHPDKPYNLIHATITSTYGMHMVASAGIASRAASHITAIYQSVAAPSS